MSGEPHRRLFAIAWLLVLGLAAGACGQKGPLYLPGESPETVAPGASPPQTTEEQAAEEEDREPSGDAP